MAKAKKLPSGTWRTLVYSHTEITDGKKEKKYESFTADTKSESEYLAAEFKCTRKSKKSNSSHRNLTVAETIQLYIELSENLSPTTLQGYRKILQSSFTGIMSIKVKDLDDEIMQIHVNKEAKRMTYKKKLISPKTVANEYGLLASAIKKIHKLDFDVSLPKKIVKNVELPEPKVVLQAIQGTSIELPCMLAIWLSYSISEVRGIKCSSIRNGVIYIDQVVVDVNNRPLEKNLAKVETRIRKQTLPSYLKKLIEAQPTYQNYLSTHVDRYLVEMNYSQISGRLKTIMKNNGLDLTFHKLRHLNASVMLVLKIPEKYAMERGGWKTPHTMKKVYQHTFSESRLNVDAQIDDYFNKILENTTRNTTQISKLRKIQRKLRQS